MRSIGNLWAVGVAVAGAALGGACAEADGAAAPHATSDVGTHATSSEDATTGSSDGPDVGVTGVDSAGVGTDATTGDGDTAAQPETGGPTHILLFGGHDGGPPEKFLGDTWTWDGHAWTQHAGPGPRARWGAVGGARGGEVVIFGGVGEPDADGVSTNAETWRWGGAGWTQLEVAGPSSRGAAQGGMAGDKLIVYGGYDHAGMSPNDVWSWDGVAWHEEQPSQQPPPHAPFAQITLGAVSFGDAVLFTTGPEFWSWADGWRAIHGDLPFEGPAARMLPSLAVLRGEVVMFGGDDGTRPLGDTWVWNGAFWDQAPSTPNHPAARAAAGMATIGDEVFLFGGQGAEGVGAYGDTWRWDGQAWQALEVAGPSARADAIMIAY